jgi:hypothetical protein
MAGNSGPATRKDPPVVPVALVLGTVLIYANTLLNGFVWDDFPVLVDNPAVRDLGNLPQFFTDYRTGVAAEGMAYYRPLRTLVFAIVHHAFGLSPLAYHALNGLVHVVNVLLTYAVFTLLSGTRGAGMIVAAVFASHPIMTEAVANVTGFADLLSASLVLLSLYLHLGLRRRGSWHPGAVAAVYVCFGLALLAKEMAITLPLLVVLSDLLLRRRRNGFTLHRGYSAYLLGFVAIAAAFVWWRSHLLGGLASGEWMGVTFTRTMLMQAAVVAKYLRLLLIPVRQSVRHEVGIPESYLDPGALGALGVIAIVVFIAAYNMRRNTHVAFGIAWFFITLLPVMNIVPLRGAMIGERFLYVPMLGLAYAAVRAVASAGVHGRALRSVPISLVVTVVLLTTLSVLTARRNAVWRDNVTVFETAVRVSPRSNALRVALIREYERLGQPAKADEHRRAGVLNTQVYVMQYLRLASRAAGRGNTGEAEGWYRRVLRLDRQNRTAAAALEAMSANRPNQ